MNDRLLKIYLNDHLAAARASGELAKRCRSSNRSGPLADCLDRVSADLTLRRAALMDCVRRLGATPSTGKQAAGWLAEKIGRLKLNGRLLSYSDLSRVLEIEGLILAYEAERGVWSALAELNDTRFADIDPAAWATRTGGMLEELRQQHAEAALQAFGSPG